MEANRVPSGISVIMPSYNQSAFILRSIRSLLLQTFTDWELIIINDGSTDDTETAIQKYINDSRIRYFRNEANKGLGVCLNKGIGLARNAYIAYLPSDDLYFKDHLQSLYRSLLSSPTAILACSGVRHYFGASVWAHSPETSMGTIDGLSMQLVQVLHKKTSDQWIEREELVTDDLDKMFWHKLLKRGKSCSTSQITCEWVDHLDQRHKMIREDCGGGIFKYKKYYRINQLIKFKSSLGNYIDEVERYRSFRGRPRVQRNDALKIMLVGELSYSPERVVALEEKGHKLYGLWLKDPSYFHTVGPLPFGNVEDIPYENWKQRTEEIAPDIIYALLNNRAIPLSHEVLLQNPGIPFVWHFKEGPFLSRQNGTWSKLIDLYSRSDGQIYINNEVRDWYLQYIDEPSDLSLILDGDLPKELPLKQQRSPLLSEKDGEIHTVVPGRPIGISQQLLQQLTMHKVHLHFYGDIHQGLMKGWIRDAHTIAGQYFHVHPNCTQENWVTEFSQYDAGWTHIFQSNNNCELAKADWNDLNLPARIATLGVAGVPLLQLDNSGHIVASQSLVKQHEIGYFSTSVQQLKAQMKDRNKALRIRANAWNKREIFTFDHHVDRLIEFFRRVIDKKRRSI